VSDLIRNAWAHWFGQFVVSMSIAIPLIVVVTLVRVILELREKRKDWKQ
jgi:hypothetical protein